MTGDDRAGSPAAVPGLLEKFDQLNAATELSCSIRCPDYSYSQTLDLDIARFLWLEVRSAARKPKAPESSRMPYYLRRSSFAT
jgi:hypothetical protein